MDGVDAFSGVMRRHSPYHSNFNNPLRFLDPDGNESQDFTYTDGYGTYSSRNSSGSVGFSGSYQDAFGDDKPKPKNTTTIPTSTKNGVQSSESKNATTIGLGLGWTTESLWTGAIATMSASALATIAIVSTIVQGDSKPPKMRIALGTDKYLDDFSLKTFSLSYKSGWAKVSDTPAQVQAKLIALGNQKDTEFHFNLSTPNGLVNSPINLSTFADKTTTLEFRTVMTLFRDKTTFYVKSGSIYKPKTIK